MPRMARISRAGPTGLSRPSGAARRAPGGPRAAPRGRRGAPPYTTYAVAPHAAPPRRRHRTGGVAAPRVLCGWCPVLSPSSSSSLLLLLPPVRPAAPNAAHAPNRRAHTRAQPSATDSQTRGARSHTLRTLIQGHRPKWQRASAPRAPSTYECTTDTRSLGNAQPCCRAPRHIEPLITYTRTHARTHTHMAPLGAAPGVHPSGRPPRPCLASSTRATTPWGGVGRVGRRREEGGGPSTTPFHTAEARPRRPRRPHRPLALTRRPTRRRTRRTCRAGSSPRGNSSCPRRCRCRSWSRRTCS